MKITYIALLLSAFLMCLFFKSYVAFIFLLLLLVLPLFLLLVNSIVICNLSVEIMRNEKDTTIGQGLPVTIKINNRSIFSLLHGKLMLQTKHGFFQEVDDYCFKISVPARNSVIIQTELVAKHCGKTQYQLQRIYCYDFLGISCLRKKIEKTFAFATMPYAYQLETIVSVGQSMVLQSMQTLADKRGDDVSQVFDYRQYRPGDSLKGINWKLSARLDDWMVKEFSQPVSNTVLLFLQLHLSPQDDLLDRVDMELEIFLWAAQWMLEHHYGCNLGWNNQELEDIVLIPLKGQESLTEAMEEIYAIDLSDKEEEPTAFLGLSKQTEFFSMVYITTHIDDITLLELTKASEEKQITIIYVSNGKELSEDVVMQLQQHDIAFVAIDLEEMKKETELKSQEE